MIATNPLPTIFPVAALLQQRPDLAPAVAQWLLADTLHAMVAYAPPDARRLRQQRTRARAALAEALALRTAYGLFWHLAGDRFLASIAPDGTLSIWYVAAQDRNIEITNLIRRLVDARAKWRA